MHSPAPVLAALAIAAHAPGHLSPGAVLGTIQIPRIALTARVEQAGEDIYTQQWPVELNGGPAHYPDTSLPWQPGVVGIAGHRVTHTRPFRYVNLLRKGDAIILHTRWGTFWYRVIRMRIVSPDDIAVIHGKTGHWLTLTACNPPGFATTRITIRAKLVKETS